MYGVGDTETRLDVLGEPHPVCKPPGLEPLRPPPPAGVPRNPATLHAGQGAAWV